MLQLESIERSLNEKLLDMRKDVRSSLEGVPLKTIKEFDKGRKM